MQNSLTLQPMNAGLSNQKFALLGLASACLAQKKPLVLPKLVDYKPPAKSHREILFEDIFCVDKFVSALSGFGVDFKLAESSDEALIPLDCFAEGTQLLIRSTEKREARPTTSGFSLLGAMWPNERIMEAIENIHDQIQKREISAAVQLRIEKDWQAYFFDRLSEKISGQCEEIPLSAERIFSKVFAQFGNTKNAFYVTCNESDLLTPLDSIKNQIKLLYGYDLVFKSELLGESLEGRSTLEQALIDFEIVQKIGTFVGLTRSTFFNVAAATSYARSNTPGLFFAYNCVGDALQLRTDNGAYPNVARACAKRVS